MIRSITLCRTLLVLGVMVGLPSIYETLSFSWNPEFRAPALRLGPTHTNYHAFREFTLTLGAVLIMLWAMFQPTGRRSRGLWVCMLLAALFYYGGWWLPWPLLGLRTPNWIAEAVHDAAALLSVTAVLLAWRSFNHGTRTELMLRSAESARSREQAPLRDGPTHVLPSMERR